MVTRALAAGPSRDDIGNLGGLCETEARAWLPVRGGEGDNRKQPGIVGNSHIFAAAYWPMSAP